jgi:hypothetical protein
MDTSKHVFQLHGVNAAEEPVLRRKLRRNDMVVFFERLIPSPIDQNRCAQSRNPIDIIVQGWSTSLFQAKQQCWRMSS